MKLNVGCGNEPIEGYINVDLFYNAPGVHIDDARTLATFPDASADEIYASHVLEHLGKYEAGTALNSWYRVLKPGGRLIVIVPDVPKMIREWLNFYLRDDPQTWEFRSMAIWGNQLNDGQFHKWGYDMKSLHAALQAAHFTVTSIRYEDGLDFNFGSYKDGCIRAFATR